MTIAEVSKKFGLSPDTLRYYERIGRSPGYIVTKGIYRITRSEKGTIKVKTEDFIINLLTKRIR
nr:MerR family DNA-binding transcriptional regulator [Thermoanaerobacter sp. CM-CNRG TB177]